MSYEGLIPQPLGEQYLIIPTEELVRSFHQAIGGADALMQMDQVEIITQVIEALLNDETFGLVALAALPNEDRLLDGNRIEQARLKKAVYNLGCGIRQLLLNLGAYSTQHGFPFIFDRLIGCDIRLRQLSE